MVAKLVGGLGDGVAKLGGLGDVVAMLGEVVAKLGGLTDEVARYDGLGDVLGDVVGVPIPSWAGAAGASSRSTSWALTGHM